MNAINQDNEKYENIRRRHKGKRCGSNKHAPRSGPVYNKISNTCQKRGHFASQCNNSADDDDEILCIFNMKY